MYLYGCSNHYPDPLKENIGSKDSKTRSPQIQMKKVDARTLVRQHTANLLKQQIQNLNSHWAIKEMVGDVISVEIISWNHESSTEETKLSSSSWPLMEMQNQLGSVPTSTDTACVTDLGVMRARLTSVASKNFGTALLLTIKKARCTYDASLKKPSTLSTNAQPLPVFDCGFR